MATLWVVPAIPDATACLHYAYRDQGDRSLISLCTRYKERSAGQVFDLFHQKIQEDRTLCIRYKLDGHCGRPFFVALGQATITDWTDVTSISTYVHENIVHHCAWWAMLQEFRNEFFLSFLNRKLKGYIIDNEIVRASK